MDLLSGIFGGLLGLAGAKGSSDAAKDAAKAQIQAADAAAAAQLEMFEQSRQDAAPWVAGGQWAMNALVGDKGMKSVGGGQQTAGGYWTEPEYSQQITGYKTVTNWDGVPVQEPVYGQVMTKAPQWVPQSATGKTGSMPFGGIKYVGKPGLIEKGPGEFTESPSYQFAQEEGLKGIQRMASATGRLGSGSAMKAAARYSEDLASQEYDNFLRRWYQSLDPYFTLAGMGQVSAGQTNQNALLTGRGVAQNYLSRGEAQAAGQLGQAYPYNALANWGAGQAMNYAMNNYNPSGGWNELAYRTSLPKTGYAQPWGY